MFEGTSRRVAQSGRAAPIACLLVVLLIGAAVRADPSDGWASFASPVFRHFSQDDGLPNPIVTAFAEDGDGFLWVGTQGGLGRWDGYGFRTYKAAAAQAGALPDNWITSLHTDARGRLWVGTSAGGLALYEADHDQFRVYAAGQNALSGVHVSALADDGSGGLWVGTAGGLDHLDPATGHIYSVRHRPGDPGSLPDDRIMALLRDRSGTLWVGTRGGLAKCAENCRRFNPVSMGYASSSPIEIANLMQDSGGRIWIGTTKLGAFVIAAPGAAPRAVIETGKNSNLQHEWIYAMTDVDPNEVWLGTYGQGIVCVDPNTGKTRRIHHDPLLPHSLSDDTIWALHRDLAGAIWTGTTVGLSRLMSSTMNAVLTVSMNTPQKMGLSEPEASALLSASDGRLWVGLQTKGIDILDPADARVTNIPSRSGTPEAALPDTFVLAMAEWPEGGIFIGTNRGLYRTDAADRRVHRVEIKGRDPAARNGGLLAAAGKLWVAGTDDGLWAMTPGDTSGSLPLHFDGTQLTDTRATVLATGAAGDLWIGTNNGLNRLDLASNRIERILPDARDPLALAAGYISTLLLDRTGRLWVGTSGGGIQVLVGRKDGRPIFRRLSTQQGLPDDNVDSLLADATGRIWVATDNGIAIVDPVAFTVRALHRADGVSITAYWAGSAAIGRAGALVFGGIGGLTVIRPERFKPWDYRPPIVITDVRVGGRAINGGRSEDRAGDATLVVRPNANSLAVQFSALDFSAPELNRYAYKLEGYDRDWTETDPKQRLATYANLPPGRYVLRLRGSNRDGRWTEGSLNLPVRVLPMWYQMMWFKITATLLAALGVLALVQGRTFFLRRRQRDLECLVAERTAALEASKHRIEQLAYQDSLTGLSNRRLFTENIQTLLAQAERQQRRFALLMIDLDRFKRINDTLGHDAGDALLIAAAQRLQAALRTSDRIARLGGDEFAILLDDLPETHAAQMDSISAVCQRLIDGFVDAIPFNDVQMTTSASIGVAIYPDHGRNREELCKAADLALYEAKRSGRNAWRCHGAKDVAATT